MEERPDPPAGNRRLDTHPPPSPRFYHNTSSSLEPPQSLPLPPPYDQNNIITLLPPPPGSETLIVQVPRDQVYRVPPPENSKIVESYLKQTNVKKGPGICFWILIVLVVIGVFLGIFFGVIHALYKPKVPEFELTSFIVNQPPQKHAKPSYEISFYVKNPNERMEVWYRDDRYGLLTFKQKRVAEGKFISFSQEAKKSSKLTITLKEDAKVAMPSEMESSMKSTKKKKPVYLEFKLFVRTKILSWAKISKKDIVVTCNFKVNSLAKGTKIVDEECSSEVQ